MQGGGGRDHDGKPDQHRRRHSDIGVETDALDRARRLLGRFLERFALRHHALVFRLLRGLPEEDVRGHGDPEQGDRVHEPLAIERRPRYQGARDAGPRNVGGQQRRHIGEHRQGAPLQHRHVTRIAHEHLQEHARAGKQRNVEKPRSADQHMDDFGHGTEIGTDLDRIGKPQQRDAALQQPVRVMQPDIAGEPVAGGPAEPPAHLLDRRRDRKEAKRDPAERKAELGSGLRVGSDRGRVVVGSPADQPRSQAAPGRQFRWIEAQWLERSGLRSLCS